MTIRSSVSTRHIIIEEQRVNVPIPGPDLSNHRGTASTKGNPYDGSTLDLAGVPQEIARSVSMGFANVGVPPLPNDMPVQDLLANLRMANNRGNSIEHKYRNRIRSPLTAIRAWCVESMGGSTRLVAECDNLSCPFWALRFGKNGHHGKKA